VPAAEALAREGVELRVAGGHRPQFAAEQGLGALKLLGHVPDEHLPALYAAGAACLVAAVVVMMIRRPAAKAGAQVAPAAARA